VELQAMLASKNDKVITEEIEPSVTELFKKMEELTSLKMAHANQLAHEEMRERSVSDACLMEFKKITASAQFELDTARIDLYKSELGSRARLADYTLKTLSL
jgi:hypothetical protein